jgi:hypothetical protein
METLALGLHLLPAGIYRVQPLFRLFLSIFQQRLQPMKSLPDTQSDHRSHQRRKHPATTEWNNLFNRDERGEHRCLISFLWHKSDGQTSPVYPGGERAVNQAEATAVGETIANSIPLAM